MVGNGVTSIGNYAFESCSHLSGLILGSSVASIGGYAFDSCTSLTNVTLPASLTSIGNYAFAYCTSLTAVNFQGNAPSAGSSSFYEDAKATGYYSSGTTGWGSMLGDLPMVPLGPQVLTSVGGIGVRTNRFGFTITGSNNIVVVVEACSNLANPTWYPLQTNTLAGGSFYFSDPQWTNYPGRFYRLSPQ
jgi:hypothetical protein